MITDKTLEQAAMEVRNDRKRLRARLSRARYCLFDYYRVEFRTAQFDFDNACLWSQDRKMKLQWVLRDFPDAPVSYNNQQTSEGSVMLFAMKDASK